MIAHLKGQLLIKTPESIIIDAGGIGYEVFVPLSTFYNLPEKYENVSLHIYTHVREDALMLFGFQSQLEKSLFMMLISVSGIGPKLAVNILSGIGPQELLEAIANGDAVRLRSIPGIGKKTAERIALELKDKACKLTGFQDIPTAPKPVQIRDTLTDDALSALVNLGYSTKVAEHAVQKAKAELVDGTLEEIIKKALKILA